jgi:MOSC domain-containing protein
MKRVGRVESLWRYPVKSMRGERLSEAFAGFAGIYGDRLYALHSTGAPVGFPFLTGREQEHMLLYKPMFRRVERMSRPPNLDEAEALAPGVTPVYPGTADTAVDVETPDGEKFSIDDPSLINRISEGLRDRHTLSLLRSDRSMTDCRPVSVFGIWTARQLSDEIETAIDQRRFRANIYVDFESQKGFAEDELVGGTLKIGSKATIAILERDPRCKMITLDPETAQQNPEVMRCVARNHDGKAGVYAAVLIEGTIRPGDEVALY